MERKEVLRTASEAVAGSRQAAYGDVTENFTMIAKGWAEIFDVDVTPEQVALAMAWLKIARLSHNPTHTDSWVDLAGYAALGSEVGDKALEHGQPVALPKPVRVTDLPNGGTITVPVDLPPSAKK